MQIIYANLDIPQVPRHMLWLAVCYKPNGDIVSEEGCRLLCKYFVFQYSFILNDFDLLIIFPFSFQQSLSQQLPEEAFHVSPNDFLSKALDH